MQLTFRTVCFLFWYTPNKKMCWNLNGSRQTIPYPKITGLAVKGLIVLKSDSVFQWHQILTLTGSYLIVISKHVGFIFQNGFENHCITYKTSTIVYHCYYFLLSDSNQYVHILNNVVIWNFHVDLWFYLIKRKVNDKTISSLTKRFRHWHCNEIIHIANTYQYV